MDPESIVEALTSARRELPRRALRAAAEAPETVTPALLELLRDDIDDLEDRAEQRGYWGHLFAMYLLAQFREPRAYPLIIEFLRQDWTLVDGMLGDALTESIPPILASVCARDTTPLKQLVEDPALDGHVRATGLKAMLILVAEGDLRREEALEYFGELLRGGLEREWCHVWDRLACCACDLCPESLMPEIDRAFADELIDEGWIDRSCFEEALADGPEVALAKLREGRRGLYIRDTYDQLKGWHCFQPPRTVVRRELPPPALQALTPPRVTVGRNDPCPCGSGKKYKRCCAR